MHYCVSTTCQVHVCMYVHVHVLVMFWVEHDLPQERIKGARVSVMWTAYKARFGLAARLE